MGKGVLKQATPDDAVLRAVVDAWESLATRFEVPPSQSIKLWQNENRVIYIEESWGPAVPYPAVQHADGRENHGYRRVKFDAAAILAIPEVSAWPELRELMLAINGKRSPVESVGCECGFFPDTDAPEGPGQLGCYVGLILSDLELNKNPKLLLKVAAHLSAAMVGCETWWGSIELGLERLRLLFDVAVPWGLQVRISNRGRTRQEARKFWSHSLEVVRQAVLTL